MTVSLRHRTSFISGHPSDEDAAGRTLLALGYEVAKTLYCGHSVQCVEASYDRKTKKYSFLIEMLPEIPTEKKEQQLLTGNAEAVLGTLLQIPEKDR